MAFLISNSKMPGLNFEAPTGIRDLEFLMDQTFAEEQRRRLQLAMAAYRASGPQAGIADELNPRTATPGSSRPLCVQSNAGNPLTIDVLPGIAVTKAGNIVILDERVSGVSLANSGTDIQNVVFVEYKVIDDADTNVATAYNTVEAVRRVTAPAESILQVATLTSFTDPSQFSATRLNDVVVLALVKVIQNSSPPPTTILSIDMTNNVNAYVRPWFSPVDQEHRSKVGTGAVTDNNPHGTSLNDEGIDGVTIFQMLLPHGSIISRDLDVPGCPGQLCTELVDASRLRDDDGSGTKTGVANAKYVTLNSFPTRIVGARANKLDENNKIVPDLAITANQVAVELLPGSNILRLAKDSTFSEALPTYGFTVYYTATEAVRPPALPFDITKVSNNTVQFGSPKKGIDTVVTGGLGMGSVPVTTMPVGNAGPIPKHYTVFLDGSKQFIMSPQVLECAKRVQDVGTANNTPQFAMYGNARLRVGLWNATPQSPPPSNALDVEIELIGKDIDGGSLTEKVTFGSTWNVGTVYAGLDPFVFKTTSNVFSELTSWRVSKANYAGADALVMVYADIEPTTTAELNDSLPICSMYWNGQSVEKVTDIRPVTARLEPARPLLSDMPAAMISAVALRGDLDANQFDVLCVEDFKSPHWLDSKLSTIRRHHDSLRTAYTTESLSGALDASENLLRREVYYSRAIPIPTPQSRIQIAVFGELGLTVENMGSVLGTSDVTVQFQVASRSLPTQWSTWQFPNTYANSTKLFTASLTANYGMPTAGSPYLKIRFRMFGKGLRGFAVLLKRA